MRRSDPAGGRRPAGGGECFLPGGMAYRRRWVSGAAQVLDPQLGPADRVAADPDTLGPSLGWPSQGGDESACREPELGSPRRFDWSLRRSPVHGHAHGTPRECPLRPLSDVTGRVGASSEPLHSPFEILDTPAVREADGQLITEPVDRVDVPPEGMRSIGKVCPVRELDEEQPVDEACVDVYLVGMHLAISRCDH